MQRYAALLIHRFTVRLRALSQVLSGPKGDFCGRNADKLPTAQVGGTSFSRLTSLLRELGGTP